MRFLIMALALLAFAGNAAAHSCYRHGYYHVCKKIHRSNKIHSQRYVSSKRHLYDKRFYRSVRYQRQVFGSASYYYRGKRTASGERFDPNRFTAAHRYFPFGSRVRVTNIRNGKSVVVTINDRGPFVGSRIIDLSYAAASVIGMIRSGVAYVEIERID